MPANETTPTNTSATAVNQTPPTLSGAPAVSSASAAPVVGTAAQPASRHRSKRHKATARIGVLLVTALAFGGFWQAVSREALPGTTATTEIAAPAPGTIQFTSLNYDVAPAASPAQTQVQVSAQTQAQVRTPSTTTSSASTARLRTRGS